MFESLTSRFSSAFSSLRSRGKISSADIDATCAEIRQALLESDVAFSVVESFVEQIREKSLAALPTMQSATKTLSPASYFSSQWRTALRTAGTAVVIGQE